jgi:hypothetical protein
LGVVEVGQLRSNEIEKVDNKEKQNNYHLVEVEVEGYFLLVVEEVVVVSAM